MSAAAQSRDAFVTRGGDRVLRLLYGATGLGAIAFGLLSLDLILVQFAVLQPWYAWATLIVSLGMPVLIALGAAVLPLRALAVAAVATILAYLALFIVWPMGMVVETLPNGSPPWIAQIAAVHGTLATLTCLPVVAWSYVGAVATVVGVVRFVAFGGDPFRLALLDGLNALLIMVILGGVAVALRSAARDQDAAMARAHTEAIRVSSLQGGARESARIDGIVHDDIISALLTAGRDVTGEVVQRQAERALRRIEMLSAAPEVSPTTTPRDFVWELGRVIAEVDPDVVLAQRIRSEEPIPGEVAGTLLDASREAARNIARHAGGAGAAGIVIVPGEIVLTMTDGGPGFVPSAALALGGGLRVSLVERMASLAGGSATIESAPEGGTTVTLRWLAS